MTHNIFFISDHHLGQQNVLTFKRNDGTPLRDFRNIQEMHEHIIDKHNSVVRPQDKVYFLGDVCFKKEWLYLLDRFNGKKRLVRGNHDIFKTDMYRDYFEEIHGCRVFAGLPNKIRIAATHVPIHPNCLERWALNVHGHLHSNFITNNTGSVDKRYVNVCVDNTNTMYTPVSMDELLEYINSGRIER